MNNVNLLKEMQLFVRVVHCNGMAAAGRELGITPSSVTMRIKKLEEHYQVKLITRTTRSINLTEEGHDFYQDCLNALEMISEVENKLSSGRNMISGTLRITTTSDLGRQHIVPALDQFIETHPLISPYVELSDAITNLTANNMDLGIRYGVSNDSSLIARKLTISRRVLCASPKYLEQFGTPKTYTELKHHRCLTMVQIRTPISTWYFDTPQGEKSLAINPSRSSNDGAQIRHWALAGAGIALKSLWDVAHDLATGQLVTVLDKQKPNYQSQNSSVGSDLYVVYRDRKYMPDRTRAFIDYMIDYFEKFTQQSDMTRFF